MNRGKGGPLETGDVIDHIPQSIFTADMDGIIQQWNKASEELLGYSSSEMANQSYRQIYPETDQSDFGKSLHTLRDGRDYSTQQQAVTKDGSTVWIQFRAHVILNAQGHPVYIVGTLSKVEELRETKTDLYDLKIQLEAVLETTVDGVAIIDEEGCIRSFNKAASRIFGYSEEEIIGENYRILIPDHHQDGTGDYLKRIFDIESQDFIGNRREITGRRKDGTIFPMELSVTKTSYNNRTVFTGVVNDISERRRLEQEILWISEEERRNIGQDMHDGLGQILTGVGLISKTLARKLERKRIAEAEDVRQISEMVKEANEQARALAHGLIHVGVKEDGLYTSLKRLCERVQKLFGIECRLDIDTDIMIDNEVTALNLYRIAQEAINNAYKHGEADKVEIILKQEGNFLNLFIDNNGAPFSLADVDEEKTGMGIHIMRYRSHMISGRFDIMLNEEGQTRTCCRVPLAYCKID